MLETDELMAVEGNNAERESLVSLSAEGQELAKQHIKLQKAVSKRNKNLLKAHKDKHFSCMNMENGVIVKLVEKDVLVKNSNGRCVFNFERLKRIKYVDGNEEKETVVPTDFNYEMFGVVCAVPTVVAAEGNIVVGSIVLLKSLDMKKSIYMKNPRQYPEITPSTLQVPGWDGHVIVQPHNVLSSIPQAEIKNVFGAEWDEFIDPLGKNFELDYKAYKKMDETVSEKQARDRALKGGKTRKVIRSKVGKDGKRKIITTKKN